MQNPESNWTFSKTSVPLIKVTLGISGVRVFCFKKHRLQPLVRQTDEFGQIKQAG
jgi:type IV secretory pathway TrbF-like protein